MQHERESHLAMIEQLQREKQDLHTDLQMASDYMATLEDKVYTANKTSLELLQ